MCTHGYPFKKIAMNSIELQIARWGNSLAIRLPATYARRAGVNEGDTLVLEEAPDGTLTLRPIRRFDRRAFLEEVQKHTASMPMGKSVIEEMRRDARY